MAVLGNRIPVTDGDWSISTPWSLEDLAEADTVIVPIPTWTPRRILGSSMRCAPSTTGVGGW